LMHGQESLLPNIDDSNVPDNLSLKSKRSRTQTEEHFFKR